ncbi:NAD(P)/FAD-dependent oxidoreductase [Pseudomonas simiae]|jgi:glycine/D-amino acid oxidase-like deaminating enzyme|uniref:FAD-dependent oxidoreductase n=1 Tax=Pseudomonas simiae TaxID=321846 RepID=U1TW47_9PSED|nr:FAD-dependent oxidoreductase [Pseudomonas simiae]AJZ95912.1 FAD-dependent oxidoreductase [Pseudomonas simiae]ERH48333.1 FAD-dependent oxidoreductase [Pseudomonas simiae]MBI6616395.1 FAD-binding oxidoreductase [Pseudomonas simiae]MBJ2230853.1 FAD-binding oxidoreductase [Pseudomonas simiae]WLH15666.1 FAD-dependent oxidoreductase [Pseudomonas simiae]
MSDPDIVVVGAGIIGVACALQLARQGQQVWVVDQQEPGMGASYGNAGHLATEQVFPIADLSILKRLPGMLLDPMGPLRLDWKYLPHALPWFLRLLLNLRPASYQRTVAGIRTLNEGSLGAWQRLLHSIGHPQLLREDGSLLVFERADSRDTLNALQQRMQQQQVPVDFWSGDAIRQAAPQLSDNLQGGLFFPGTGHFLDPYHVVCELVHAAKASGVQFLKRQVLDGRVDAHGVSLSTDQGPLTARQVLIACGAHSARLTAALTGKKVPLDTERGYHLMLPHEHNRLPFAVTSLERKFIMTPMTHGLRLAGTVEFAGLDRPANMARAWQLHRLSKGLFREELSAEGATPWMGFRPSLPDSLPVIDRVCDGKVLLAFGHQHLGLTQAAVTAEWVGALARTGQAPSVAPYRLDRF